MATGLIANGYTGGSTGPLISYTPQTDAKVAVTVGATGASGASMNINGVTTFSCFATGYYYAFPQETHIYVAAGTTITFQASGSMYYCISSLEEQS